MNCILEKFPGNFGDPRVICSVMNGSPTGEEGMTPPLAHDPPNAAPDEGPAVSRLTAVQAHELIAAGRGVLVDTRDARLFDNAHAAGARSEERRVGKECRSRGSRYQLKKIKARDRRV